MRLELEPYVLENPGGLEIAVKGYLGCDCEHVPSQIFIEVYQGKLAVHVWDGTSQDCKTHVIKKAIVEVPR